MSLNVNNNVGYTVVDGGSIHIENGIVSGFSSNDYAYTASNLTYTIDSNYANLEFVTRIKPDSLSSDTFALHYNTYSWISSGVGTTRSGKARFFIGRNSNGTDIAVIGTTNLTTSAFYYLKGIVKNNKAILLLSSDGQSWNEESSVNLTGYTFNITGPVGIGKSTSARDYIFNGSIDLNETYIKVNGVTWFNGKQTASTTVNEVYLNNNVGYTVVDGGSIHIENGVASGFSGGDYLDIGNFLGDNIHSIENGVKFTTASTFLSQSIMGRAPEASPLDTGIFFRGATPGITAKYRISYDNGNSWQVIELPSSFTSIVSNHTYYANWSISTITNKMIVRFSEDGQNWITDELSFEPGAILENLTNQKIGRTGNHGAFLGSIDLNNTYIKVNGITWFSGKEQASPTINEVYLNRNVGYDIVGNPTIVDGVASGFSANDYVRTVKNFPTNNISTLEWGCKFTTGSNVNYQAITGTGSYWGCYGFRLGDYGSLVAMLAYSPDIIISFPANTIKSNSTYISKAYWNTTTKEFSAKVSGDNGKTWTTSSMVVSDDFSYRDVPVQFGKTQAGNFRGSIDLNETYIKINGVTWFNGKQTATTPVWTRSV